MAKNHRRLFCVADHDVATVAEKSSDLLRLVIMVDGEVLVEL